MPRIVLRRRVLVTASGVSPYVPTARGVVTRMAGGISRAIGGGLSAGTVPVSPSVAVEGMPPRLVTPLTPARRTDARTVGATDSRTHGARVAVRSAGMLTLGVVLRSAPPSRGVTRTSRAPTGGSGGITQGVISTPV